MEWVFPYPSSLIDDGGSISSATASSTNYTQLDSISSYGDSKGSEPSCTYPPFPTSTPVQQNSAGAGAGSLLDLLMACAEAVQENDLTLAESLVKRIGFRAVFQTGTMRKLAFVFAEALSRRIYKLSPQNPIDHHSLSKHFYEACPFLKFAHFTCNQAILEAFRGKERVHVIDFSINRGLQWQPLLQALALRPGGPPAFRLSGIGPPSHDNSDYHHEIGRKLARLAETIHIEFEYRGVIAESLADLTASMLDLRPGGGESVAVNSVFELHKLLARPCAIDYVLSLAKQMEPEVVTIAEQEANHNEPVFLDRFTESLHYYSNVFVSMEGSTPTDTRVDDKTIVEFLSNNSTSGLDWSVGVDASVRCFKDTPNKGMAQEYLEKQICNIVACEGAERVERHETLSQWQTRFDSAGFVPLFLEANASRQASILFAKGDEYRVEQNNGCLMVGWRTRPLVTTSFWRPANT